MSETHTFTATLRSAMDEPGDAWSTVVVPAKVASSFDTKAMVAVRGMVNGAPYRSSLFPDGKGGFHMMVNAKLRDAARVSAGDRVRVEMALDTAPRTVRAPVDLTRALKRNTRAKRFWDGLAYSNKKLYVDWIAEAKRTDTRERRVAQTVQNMEDGKARQR